MIYRNQQWAETTRLQLICFLCQIAQGGGGQKGGPTTGYEYKVWGKENDLLEYKHSYVFSANQLLLSFTGTISLNFNLKSQIQSYRYDLGMLDATQ